MKIPLRRYLRNLGPGLITAALVFGPGSLTVTTKLGSGFGFSLLWILPMAIVFMISYTQMTARIGLAGDQSLMELIRDRYGKWVTLFLGICIFVITASFQAGNAIGAGIAFAGLVQSSSTPWVVFFSLAAISLLFFQSFYKILERIMVSMVLLMLLSFLLTLVLSQPSWSEILLGLIPSVPKGSELLVIAILASSFSVTAAFYQAYLVREKGWGAADMKTAMTESSHGIITLGLLSGMILMCASAVLYEKNIPVNSAADLGRALEPLFGRFASYAFLLGFFAASFSSLIGNATIGGAMFADACSQGKQLRSWRVRIFIIGVIIIGATVAIYFGALPLQLIIFAQAFTILFAPIAAIFLLLIANDPKIMGQFVNTRQQNILPMLGLGLLLFLAGYHIIANLLT